MSQSVGVIAALSPGCAWNRNLEYAEQVLEASAAGRTLPMVGSYGSANIRKCSRILSGEAPLDVLSGPKVRAFYGNILDPQDPVPVTIDRHIICAAHNITEAVDTAIKPLMKPAPILWLQAHVHRCARREGVLPSAFQAIVWTAWRSAKTPLAMAA